MTRVCYWCNKYMGEKDGNSEDGVFHSICSGCADKCEKITDYLVGFKYIKFKKN